MVVPIKIQLVWVYVSCLPKTMDDFLCIIRPLRQIFILARLLVQLQASRRLCRKSPGSLMHKMDKYG